MKRGLQGAKITKQAFLFINITENWFHLKPLIVARKYLFSLSDEAPFLLVSTAVHGSN